MAPTKNTVVLNIVSFGPDADQGTFLRHCDTERGLASAEAVREEFLAREQKRIAWGVNAQKFGIFVPRGRRKSKWRWRLHFERGWKLDRIIGAPSI
jgi:hypothetical protein